VHFLNECGFSVDSSLQGISSNLFFVETKRFVGSNVKVILTRQTCDQHSGSSMVAGSKRRANATNCRRKNRAIIQKEPPTSLGTPQSISIKILLSTNLVHQLAGQSPEIGGQRSRTDTVSQYGGS